MIHGYGLSLYDYQASGVIGRPGFRVNKISARSFAYVDVGHVSHATLLPALSGLRWK